MNEDNVFFVPFSNGGGTIVDSKDMPLVMAFTWYKLSTGYAVCDVPLKEGKQKKIRLHRLLTGFSDEQVDHINRNRLDNRKENLRLVSHRKNHQNRTNHGLFPPRTHYRKDKNKFAGQIEINGKKKHLGYFPDPLSASVVYQMVCKEIG